MASGQLMLDQTLHDRLTRVETRLEDRSEQAAEFRSEVKALLDLLGKQQLEIAKELGKLTAAFQAHLAEDRRILQRVNGNHRQERLVNIGLGTGSGAGLATIIVAIGRQMGWW